MTMISIGDEFKLTDHPHKPIGRVVDINHIWDSVILEWVDSVLMPRRQEFHRDRFFDGTLIKTPARTCECGAKFDNEMPNAHSTWCPAYIKESK